VYSKIKDYQLDYQLHKRLDGRVGINGILRSKLKKMEKEKVDMVYTLRLREASQNPASFLLLFITCCITPLYTQNKI
jgi:hypothetical protein